MKQDRSMTRGLPNNNDGKEGVRDFMSGCINDGK